MIAVDYTAATECLRDQTSLTTNLEDVHAQEDRAIVWLLP
jgi:hypothetical protein